MKDELIDIIQIDNPWILAPDTSILKSRLFLILICIVFNKYRVEYDSFLPQCAAETLTL